MGRGGDARGWVGVKQLADGLGRDANARECIKECGDSHVVARLVDDGKADLERLPQQSCLHGFEDR